MQRHKNKVDWDLKYNIPCAKLYFSSWVFLIISIIFGLSAIISAIIGSFVESLKGMLLIIAIVLVSIDGITFILALILNIVWSYKKDKLLNSLRRK